MVAAVEAVAEIAAAATVEEAEEVMAADTLEEVEETAAVAVEAVAAAVAMLEEAVAAGALEEAEVAMAVETLEEVEKTAAAKAKTSSPRRREIGEGREKPREGAEPQNRAESESEIKRGGNSRVKVPTE